MVVVSKAGISTSWPMSVTSINQKCVNILTKVGGLLESAITIKHFRKLLGKPKMVVWGPMVPFYTELWFASKNDHSGDTECAG